MGQLQLRWKVDMKLPSNVREKSKIWNLIPWISDKTAQAIYPNIYLPKQMIESLKSNKPDINLISCLIHEQEHIKRQKKMGIFFWGVKYIFSAKFRFEEEIFADLAKFRYLKKHKYNPSINRRARQLSGWNYFWPVPYRKAKLRLNTIWKSLD